MFCTYETRRKQTPVYDYVTYYVQGIYYSMYVYAYAAPRQRNVQHSYA